MPRRNDLQRSQAAQILRETGNVSETARRVGVARATIQKWQKEPGFFDQAPPVESAIGLKSFIPKAMSVIDDALDGKRITNNQIRAALEVLKASNALKEPVERSSSLAEIIAKLDAEAELESD